MALSDKEREIVKYARENGKSLTETKAAIAKYRSSGSIDVANQNSDDTTAQGSVTDTIGDGLNTILGGGKIGDAIGTQIATFDPRVQELERQEAEGIAPAGSVNETLNAPSLKSFAGDVARVGLNFVPIGKAAQGLKAVGSAIGLGKAAGTTANIVAGGATGAAFDVADDVAEGRDVALGGGTIAGAGLPAVGAAVPKVAKGLGIVSSEIAGRTTGTSQETLEVAFKAARNGGKDIDTLTEALRGRTTPEALVNQARESVNIIKGKQQTAYSQKLSELSNEVVETSSIPQSFTERLNDVQISVKPDGKLDFSKSKLELVPQAQNKINLAFNKISSLPETMTIQEIDSTRQAIKALELAGDDASANLGNKLIDDATRAVRAAGEDVNGYGGMLDDFGESAEFLEELQKGLSTQDNKTVDQAYRRLTTSLKTNNEERMKLVRELDEATDGAILSGISGQQLSEIMPRGLVGVIGASAIGTGVAFGTGVSPAFSALLFASPRVTGEFSRALGIGARKAKILSDSISNIREAYLKAGIIVGTSNSSNEVESEKNE